MSQNPYASPASSAAAVDRKDSSIKSALGMFTRHLLFLLLFVGIFLVGVSYLNSYLGSINLKLNAPTLLVLAMGRWLAKSWYLALLIVPLYFLFLVALHSADQRIPGIRCAWSVLFWTLVALFTAAIGFGFALPFL